MKRRFVKWISSYKGRIEILWSVMVGILFSMLPIFFATGGRSGFNFFKVKEWLDRFFYNNFLDEFIFGFFFTLILIWSIKQYRLTEEALKAHQSDKKADD